MGVKEEIKAVKKIYLENKKAIDTRLKDFHDVWKKGSDERVMHELIFCIFTPQSKATSCWACVEKIIEKKLLLNATPAQLLKLPEINMVRFKNKKAVYACEARDKFMKNGKPHIKEFLRQFKTDAEKREWLVKNIRGYGMKEAGHFLRNIGFTEELAILDRHILKNLVKMGAIKAVPTSLTKSRYLEIEEQMRAFTKKIGISMGALDLTLWFREAGKVFK